MKKQRISGGKVYQFLENLPQACTIQTSYYPDTIRAYDPCLFMFETEYEDFIIDLFSELPTSTTFFKVSNKLFVYAHVLKPSVRNKNLNEAAKWYVPVQAIQLSRKGIVKKKARASVDYSWAWSI